ncbi:NAD(P)/FAD-dependent oxidoreductase [Roseomonas sp. GC11]|uniref:FAD/NAD(P)-dependent oxidoreductase n=1 Tax=Roseomonas sp. GC11 TaxID=2950546 RepID=UPI00210B7288|nr:NAD(P)/FAD-dependent oxidoreductase [Roseomonas sp. GC11]MCQ4159508.1 NAD(P)/FAD-dependent oxidoreductase [Roseomonas sp. GC11]
MRRCDLIVLGAGPAGAEAALAASGAGLDVVLVEEAAAAGGQVWRAPAAASPPGLDPFPAEAEARAGAALRARLAASPVESWFGARAWSVIRPAEGGFRLDAAGPEGPLACAAPRLVAATGAVERVIPFPGWTLPGVIGLAAATVLLKAQGVLPGQRVVVAGCGPLLAAVAAKILAAGGEVVAVVDRAAPAEWLAASRALASRPRLLARGLGWALRIAGRRVPVHFAHAVRAAEGDEALRRLRIAPLDASGGFAPGGAERVLEADALCIGDGLVPGAEIPRLLRARLRFDRALGGWVPELDAEGRTSLPGLFAVGDGAGLRGQAPAVHAGRIAGLAAAQEAGRLDAAAFAAATAPERAALAGLAPFAAAMAGLMALRPGAVRDIAPETVICRCEDVTRGMLDAAFDEGAREVNQVKHFTRCGMGPCQGRSCGDVAAEIIAARLGGAREAAGFWTGRPPLRPVPLADLLGEFDYADIPIPAPAPL